VSTEAGRLGGFVQEEPALSSNDPHADLEVPSRYLLTDIWDDRASFDEFKKKFHEEYNRLDRECEALTLQEIRIGEFEKL